ncbi:hypothetical protein CEP53_015441 [Fusarium sp. AF-6]|nr:hypothetical protein CEP53_015441 [Fusarium sp. AF-6]
MLPPELVVAISTRGVLPPFTIDQLGLSTVAHTLPSIHSHPWTTLARADPVAQSLALPARRGCGSSL